MNINELLGNEIEENLNDTEKEIVNYIFKELEQKEYVNISSLEEKALQKIDEELGV